MPSALEPVSFWRCENERAQAQAVAGELERLIADGVEPAIVRSARALGPKRGPARRDRAGGARHPLPAGRRGGLLRAGRGTRPARLAAPAVRPERRERGRARPAEAAGRAFAGRSRARDADRAPAQDRHGLGARCRAPDAGGAARGARAHGDVPAAAPQRLPRVRGHAAGPVHPPPDRADRPAQAIPLQRQHGVARAAREHRQVRRARGRLGAAGAGAQLARLRLIRQCGRARRACARRRRPCARAPVRFR